MNKWLKRKERKKKISIKKDLKNKRNPKHRKINLKK